MRSPIVVRIIAIASGIAAGVGLLLFVLVSFSSAAPLRVTRAITLEVQQGTGAVTGHSTDPHGDLPCIGDDTGPDDGTQVDLQGDEVTPAVATYKFDSQGQIYETHAPHIEVPHLGSPTL